jgi:hypothetical protein
VRRWHVILASMMLAATGTAIGSGPAEAVPSCSLTPHNPTTVETLRVNLPTGGYYSDTDINAVTESFCNTQMTVLKTSSRLWGDASGVTPGPANEDVLVAKDQTYNWAQAGIPGCPAGRWTWWTQGEHEWLDYETQNSGGPQMADSGRISTVCLRDGVLFPPSPNPEPPST